GQPPIRPLVRLRNRRRLLRAGGEPDTGLSMTAVLRRDAVEPTVAGTAGGGRGRQRGKVENRWGYLFLSPWFLGLAVLTAGPMAVSLYYSFTDFALLSEPNWIGTANYERMFTSDPRFLSALSLTLRYVLIGVPLQLAFALVVALLLNRGLRALGLYRALYYLPSLLAGSVAIAVLWRQV